MLYTISYNNCPLEDFSDEDLKSELKRRELLKSKIPERLSKEKINLTKTIKCCDDYINSIHNNHPDPDIEYIFEAALEAIYGEKIWAWINEMSNC
jgi:hypothetical protein